MTDQPHVIVIGAGIGGLATALRLSHAGLRVTVLERHDWPGGKVRTIASDAGPIDAGPTVLTLKHVFEDLFADVGERLDDHVALTPLPVLARHYWRDGTRFDLHADPAATLAEAGRVFSGATAMDLRRFSRRAARLFSAFDGPMMQTAAPSVSTLAARVLREPSLIAEMAPHRTLAAMLDRQFRDPRLAQLFGRYATYVGGNPRTAPAILALIAHAEATGVWHLKDGMQALPRAIAALAKARGATFRFGSDVGRIDPTENGISVQVAGEHLRADAAVFNGDPRALRQGHLGDAMRRAVPDNAVSPRSLSACVASFAARASGPDLAHHTVFFSDRVNAEFVPLTEGRLPDDATLYVCAQDRERGTAMAGRERFEIILNAPAGLSLTQQEKQRCMTQITQRLARFGLTFDPVPTAAALSDPGEFDRLFPASQGALYGRSPKGLMAAFRRPVARSRVPGLYLAGGGAHPGAGLPMATLSARHAAAAIMQDLRLTSPSGRTGMRGGMSTGSATTGRAPSLSSAS